MMKTNNFNCILEHVCYSDRCDGSCPDQVQVDYLLELNKIPYTSPSFELTEAEWDKYKDILDKSRGKFGYVLERKNTFQVAQDITVCGIREQWEGSCLHSRVYSMSFASYLNDIQKSWSPSNVDEQFEQQQIWVNTGRILVIYGIDYINFKEFHAQTLLTLLSNRRMDPSLTTILVAPPPSMLVGDGRFFGMLCSLLKENKVG